MEQPAVLPPPENLVDTARLGATVAPWQQRNGPVPDRHVIFSLEYEPDGTNVRREILQHSFSPVVADSLQKLVFAHLLPVEEQDEPWGVRLQIALGEQGLAYQVGRRVYCPPRPRNPQLERAYLGVQTTGVRYRGGQRERVVIMRVRVHPAGYVARAEVARGESRGSTLERELAELVRQYSFFPATIDGIPVPGWTEFPVVIRGRG